MKRSIFWFLVASLYACTAPDGSPHTSRDVPDEPSAVTTASVTPAPTACVGCEGQEKLPIADRMRHLDKSVYKMNVDDLPAIGAKTAPLTVVLFSDYQCSFCKQVQPQLDQLRAEHGSDVRIVLAPKPLPFHENAKPAALAVIAAAEQGKVEAMHRALVARDGKLDEAGILEAAREAGLDLRRFAADRSSAKTEQTLARSEALSKRFSVQGTPSTFINGRRITGAVPDVIHQLGVEQLAVGRGLIKDGVAPGNVYETIIAHGLDTAPPDPSITMMPKKE